MKRIKFGIFTRDIEKAKDLINELTKGKKLETFNLSKDNTYVQCADSEYKILKFSNGSRGHKLHYAYVDRDLLKTEQDEEILNCVVKPMLSLASYHFGDNDVFSYKNHLIYF